ncbi:MAG: T9SS type A sorting domain-containing protein [Bacteroidota bacterium]
MKPYLLSLLLLGCSILPAQQRYLDSLFSQVIVLDSIVYGHNIGSPIMTGGVLDTVSLYCDVYFPDTLQDTENEHLTLILAIDRYFLPPFYNGTPFGSLKDSAVVEFATRLAKTGYTVVPFETRRGWDAANLDIVIRSESILQAIHRGMQDAHTLARFLRKSAETLGNPFRVGGNDCDIGMIGFDSGGTIALGTAFIKDVSEMELIKFQNPLTMDYFIDSLVEGNVYGSNTTPMNIPNHLGYNSEVNVVVNFGGALLDSSMIEQGEAVSISVHCDRDPFWEYGKFLSPVQPPHDISLPYEPAGSYTIARIQDRLGNNDLFKNPALTDSISSIARSRADGYEGLFPFQYPPATGTFRCAGRDLPLDEAFAPWYWYDETRYAFVHDSLGLGAVFGVNGAEAVCNQTAYHGPSSAGKAKTYIDTMMSFILPRLRMSLNQRNCLTSIEDESDLFSTLEIKQDHNFLYIQGVKNGPLPLEIELMDMQGRVLHQIKGDSRTRHHMAIANLPQGVYVLRLHHKREVASRKVFIK